MDDLQQCRVKANQQLQQAEGQQIVGKFRRRFWRGATLTGKITQITKERCGIFRTVA